MDCKCGFANAEGARFCGSCGSPIPAAPEKDRLIADTSAHAPKVTTPLAPDGGRRRFFFIPHVLLIVAVVAAAAAGYWWLQRPPAPYVRDNSELYPIQVEGKYGFMDRTGQTVIRPQFEQTVGFSEGLAGVRVGNKWGFIDETGIVVITPQFDLVGMFRNDRAPVLQGDGWGFIDRDGKLIGSPNFRHAGVFTDRLAPVITAEGSHAFLTRSGELAFLGQFSAAAEFNHGLAAAASANKFGFIDRAGKWVIEPQFEHAAGFSDGLAPVTVGGRRGFIDRKGRFVVNPQYDAGAEFRDGFARVVSGGKVGFINTTGHMVVAPRYDGAGDFNDGLAPVQMGSTWGFVDATGKMAIAAEFDHAEDFQNGLARVIAMGKEAYVRTDGAFVVNPFPGTTLKTMREQVIGAYLEKSRGQECIEIDTKMIFHLWDIGRPAANFGRWKQLDGSIRFYVPPESVFQGHETEFEERRRDPAAYREWLSAIVSGLPIATDWSSEDLGYDPKKRQLQFGGRTFEKTTLARCSIEMKTTPIAIEAARRAEAADQAVQFDRLAPLPGPLSGATSGQRGFKSAVDQYVSSVAGGAVEVYWRHTSSAVVLRFRSKAGWTPSADVDVNHNHAIDSNIDVSYGIVGSVPCFQYLLDESSSTTCGAFRSSATVEVLEEQPGVWQSTIWTIPRYELSTNEESVWLSVDAYNGSTKEYVQGSFGNPIVIPLR